MREILAGNISRYRKDLGLTQEALADKLGITFQAVSKWETAQTMPETILLPKLAQMLNVSVDKLLGYAAFGGDVSYYEDEYRRDEYFWGVQPSNMCLKVLELFPPHRPLRLLDIGCGEGKDAVFFARCGYEVSAFDISQAGLEKQDSLRIKRAFMCGRSVPIYGTTSWKKNMTCCFPAEFSITSSRNCAAKLWRTIKLM